MKSWVIYVAIAIGAVVYSAATTVDRDDTGAIVSGGNVDAFALRVGDCFDDTSSEQISQLPARPCAEPHDNEVYAVFDLDVAEFPEGDALSELAFASCRERFQAFVGLDYESSSLDIMTMYPTPESWARQNDREVVCAVYDMQANKLTGSVQGPGTVVSARAGRVSGAVRPVCNFLFRAVAPSPKACSLPVFRH